jgi:DNA polymerase elongation subunit (family B)
MSTAREGGPANEKKKIIIKRKPGQQQQQQPSKQPDNVSIRLLDFNIYDANATESAVTDSSGDQQNEQYQHSNGYKKRMVIQMFGLNEQGETCALFVEDMNPFFYVMVPSDWTERIKKQFVIDVVKKLGFAEGLIIKEKCALVKRKKLYGFDGGKMHNFVVLYFKNLAIMNRVKNLWYISCPETNSYDLNPEGFNYNGACLKIYESNIPPLLRFFHMNEISPSGWVEFSKENATKISDEEKKTTSCTNEFVVGMQDIHAQPAKETRVPYKICSFDIEASSSHGDFPLAIKTHKKLAANIVDVCRCIQSDDGIINNELLRKMIHVAFLNTKSENEYIDGNIQRIYSKRRLSKSQIDSYFSKFITEKIKNLTVESGVNYANTIEAMFESIGKKLALSAQATAQVNGGGDGGDGGDSDSDGDGEEETSENDNGITMNIVEEVKKTNVKTSHIALAQVDKDMTVLQLLQSSALSREIKITHLNSALSGVFPEVEGDKVTFIGSTFLKSGEERPYLNHCLTIDTCDSLRDVQNSEIQVCEGGERDMLLEWTTLIQREDPDIIIGYNIFGFDYNFMFHRALENDCATEFLKLSRNKDKVCGQVDPKTRKLAIEESTIVIASGQHDLQYIKMAGRLQIDMYNYLRRDYNMSSYKLDYVSGYFIGDAVTKIEHKINELGQDVTTVYTGNTMGLDVGSYISFEETSNSTESYKGGEKFKVIRLDSATKVFEISGKEMPNMEKKVRWGLAKDDVTPQDIFRMTNEGPAERAIIAKYCIQDCNLVHHLMRKIDVLTGFIEMANICSVPISFLVFRGQGIKLTSFIAKKCSEKNTLIPVLDRRFGNESYDGAIVLPPKCDLYLDNPVACVDYSSLYPSSMISENLSHDSKVWTKEYNLDGILVCSTGETDGDGVFIYDNLPGYEYVDVEYDTYVWKHNARGKAIKTVNGKKVCRFAQPKMDGGGNGGAGGEKAIMPSILEELLEARSATRKLIPKQTDDFMKNILDKRQLGYKVTANSLYGQCGAKTSSFYEIDVAASTTATGRKLLLYAKRVVEETYGNAQCQTSKYGVVNTRAEHVYGDSVAACTPVYVRFDGIIDVCPIETLAEKYGASSNEWAYCKEDGKQTKQVCEMMCGVETWSEKGWTRLHRVIRHVLAPHKKMMRIVTHTGIVDVTDDHSLILANGEEISPKNVEIGTKLLHCALPQPTYTDARNTMSSVTIEQARVMGFFFGDGSCGEYNCDSGKKHSWALNNASMEFIHKYLELCKIAYPDLEWVYYDTLKSSGVYKIVSKSKKSGSIVEFVKFYRSMMYYKQCKIIPSIIINNTQEIRESFWNGMYDADGFKDKNGCTRIDQKNQISAACICLLAQSLGWKTSLNTRSDKMDIYRMNMTKRTQKRCTDSIKKIITLPVEENQYVYDLTTNNHHFAAGIGNMIVHNTDSVFFTFNLADKDGTPIRGKQALEITIELAQQVGELASSFLKAPHSLVYEKSIMPFCLLRKKGYVGIYYETNANKGTRKSMGIVLKRRDNAPIVKDVYGGIIDILMKEQDTGRAISFLKDYLRNLVSEKIPLEKLIITKSLNSNYKNPQQIAHKVLADRMGQRDSGNKPSVGDRIPFIYIHNPDKKALQGERIEHPTYIKANNIRPNYTFYITNQIMKPVQQLFALVLEKIPGFKRRQEAFKDRIELETNKIGAENREALQKKITDLRQKEVKVLLFDEFLIQANNAINKNQSIKNFFK